MKTTLRGKVKDPGGVGLVLDQMANHLGHVRRLVFSEIIKGTPINDLKKKMIAQENVTARQFNSIRIEVNGAIDSYLETQNRQKLKIERKIKMKQEELEKTQSLFKKHHLKRKIASLQRKLEEIEENLIHPSICFGTRKLFNQQFHLEESGFSSHAEWKKAWQEARNSHFFIVGSKDESFGNQTCKLLPQGLELRLTYQVAKEVGKDTLFVPLHFSYHEQVITQALSSGQAMTYQFVKKDGKWYVHLTTDMVAQEIISDAKSGALGIDLNPSCIAVTHVNGEGNLLHSFHIDLSLKGLRSEQIEAILGDAVATCVAYAGAHKIPIVIEKLDFEKKKEELLSRAYNRMLSSFTYSLFFRLINTQCFRAGIQCIAVNPAYTSVIGKYKFSEGYGLSTHQAAAMAIARRALGFGERIRAKSQERSSRPARNRARHVWTDWARLSRKAKRRKKAPQRRHRSKRNRGDRRSSSSTSDEHSNVTSGLS